MREIDKNKSLQMIDNIRSKIDEIELLIRNCPEDKTITVKLEANCGIIDSNIILEYKETDILFDKPDWIKD